MCQNVFLDCDVEKLTYIRGIGILLLPFIVGRIKNHYKRLIIFNIAVQRSTNLYKHRDYVVGKIEFIVRGN